MWLDWNIVDSTVRAGNSRFMPVVLRGLSMTVELCAGAGVIGLSRSKMSWLVWNKEISF